MSRNNIDLDELCNNENRDMQPAALFFSHPYIPFPNRDITFPLGINIFCLHPFKPLDTAIPAWCRRYRRKASIENPVHAPGPHYLSSPPPRRHRPECTALINASEPSPRDPKISQTDHIIPFRYEGTCTRPLMPTTSRRPKRKLISSNGWKQVYRAIQCNILISYPSRKQLTFPLYSNTHISSSTSVREYRTWETQARSMWRSSEADKHMRR